MRALVVVAAALAVGGGAQEPSAPNPQQVATAEGRIESFTANGGWLAWWERATSANCPTVAFMRLATRRVTKIRTSERDHWGCSAGANSLAVAGRFAAWAYSFGGNRTTTMILAATPTRVRGSPLDSFTAEHSSFGEGGYASGPVAGGPTLAYGWYGVEIVPSRPCREDLRCETIIRRGGIRLIRGTRRGELVSRAPVAHLALSADGLAAYVRVTKAWHDRRVLSRTMLEIVDLRTGRVRRRLSAPGRVRALALSGKVLVALSRSGPTPAILRFDVLSGRLMGVSRVGRGTSTRLALSGRRLIVSRGVRLIEIDVYSGRIESLATTTGAPIGLSIARGLVAWAENARTGSAPRGRIRVLGA